MKHSTVVVWFAVVVAGCASSDVAHPEFAWLDSPAETWGAAESVGVDYLYADDEGPRNFVAELALYCLYLIRDNSPDDVLAEITDYDGAVTPAAREAFVAWWKQMQSNEAKRLAGAVE